MPEYLAPGVYVEEVDTGPKPIEGVSTSTSGMVGVTEWGPVNIATLVTGFADFQRQFGGYLDRRIYTGNTWYFPHAVEGFFTNGGKRLYVVRVLPSSATSARIDLFDQGETPDAGGLTFNRFSRTLAARVEQGGRLLLLDDNADVPSTDSWALLEAGRSSEYTQLLGAPAGIVAIANPTTAPLWASGTVVEGLDNSVPPAVLGTTELIADVLQGEVLLPVADAAVLGGATSYRIGAATDPAQESHPQADNGAVALSMPLALNHNLNAPVHEPAISVDSVGTRTLTTVPPTNPTTIALDNRALLVAGQELRITNTTTGDPPETVRIQSVTAPRVAGADPGEVVLDAALTGTYNAGDAVTVELLTPPPRTLTAEAPRGTTQIQVDDRAGILDPPPSGNRVHFLQFTNSAGAVEFVRIDGVEAPRATGVDPGNITLEWALQHDYAIGDTVALLVDTDADTNPTFLAWDADPDDRALVLGDSGAYGAGSFIRTEAITAANAEYNRVVAGSPTLRIAATPFQSAHSAETSVLGRSQLMTVQAIDPGAWGNRLRVLVDRESLPLLRETQPIVPAAATSPTLTLRTTVGIEPGSVLEFFTRTPVGVETVVFQQKVATVTGNVVSFGAGGLAQAVPANLLVRTVEFQMTIELVKLNPVTQQEEGIVTSERFRQLALDARHPRYAVRVIGPIFVDDVTTPRRADGRTEGESSLIRIRDTLTPAQTETALRLVPDILQFTPPNGQPRPFGLFFAGGNDDIGSVTPAVYIGSDGTNPPRSRTGVFALKNIDEIAIVAVPGQFDQQVQNALLTHCELLHYRFAVLDAEPGSSLAEIQDQRSLYDSKYGALYYPWLQIPDPFPDNPRVPSPVVIPPSGHTIGIYARSDIERGVHKAPANEVIRGISDLELKLTKEEQDILNPRHINVLRNFREDNRGLRVWGARVLTSDPDWKYINVRRLFIFIEKSIDRGTQWVVFEPNDEPLWQRVKRVITAFLTNVWRDGALMGRTPEEAFFVKCDRTTMTQADIDNGRLIVLIGIAPVKPAEFVIFRIGQWVGGSSLEES
jgi:uncharacterized protein